MAKFTVPSELEACCELCEFYTVIETSGESLCKYKNRLKRVSADGICKKFSFNIFAYKPRVNVLPKAFDFTKI